MLKSNKRIARRQQQCKRKRINKAIKNPIHLVLRLVTLSAVQMRFKFNKLLDCNLWLEIIANNQGKTRISIIIPIFQRLNSINIINNSYNNNHQYMIANQSNRMEILVEKLKEKRCWKIIEFSRLHRNKNCLKNITSSSASQKNSSLLRILSCKDKNPKKVLLLLYQNVILLLKKDMHCLW